MFVTRVKAYVSRHHRMRAIKGKRASVIKLALGVIFYELLEISARESMDIHIDYDVVR